MCTTWWYRCKFKSRKLFRVIKSGEKFETSTNSVIGKRENTKQVKERWSRLGSAHCSVNRVAYNGKFSSDLVHPSWFHSEFVLLWTASRACVAVQRRTGEWWQRNTQLSTPGWDTRSTSSATPQSLIVSYFASPHPCQSSPEYSRKYQMNEPEKKRQEYPGLVWFYVTTISTKPWKPWWWLTEPEQKLEDMHNQTRVDPPHSTSMHDKYAGLPKGA